LAENSKKASAAIAPPGTSAIIESVRTGQLPEKQVFRPFDVL
jgi:hypothetical protein